MRDQDVREALTFFHLCYQKFSDISQSGILDEVQVEDFMSCETIRERLEASFAALFSNGHNRMIIDDFLKNLD